MTIAEYIRDCEGERRATQERLAPLLSGVARIGVSHSGDTTRAAIRRLQDALAESDVILSELRSAA
jgi:hypothetical protein